MIRALTPLIVLSCLWAATPSHADVPCTAKRAFRLVVHGGAGETEPELRPARTAALVEALRQGGAALREGRSAVDAVEIAIVVLENAPVFNAGRGGIPNKAGFVELDASIMSGWDRNAGAVAAVRTIKNPITAARAAMERSEHLFFVDRGAVEFAKKHGLAIEDPSYFLVDKPASNKKSGTVGAVALDRCGRLAAGTSTGGFNSKTPGRVGDSPVIGAGTYATRTCAVSATGHGEFFIRWAAAHDVCALREYKGWSIGKAATTVVQRKLKPAGGTGAFIALDQRGNVATPYSSKGLARGTTDASGTIRVGFFDKMEAQGQL